MRILLKGKDELNVEVKETVSKRGEVDKRKEKFLSKEDIQESPSQIKSKISSLEKKIETEVIPYSQEKTLMKVIKSLKIEMKD